MKTHVKTVQLLVTVKVPREVSKTCLKEYVRESVQMWNKGGDPDSPLWNLQVKRVSIQFEA